MFKKIVKRVTILVLVMLAISCIKSNTYARNIKFYAKNLEGWNNSPVSPENGVAGYPDFVYRTYVSAASNTQKNYENGTLKKESDGWVYVQGDNATEEHKNKNKAQLVVTKNDEGEYVLPGTGTTTRTFRTWSVFFHPSENSDYQNEAGNMKYKEYTSEASNENVNSIDVQGEITQYEKWIDGETAEYKGIYDQAARLGNKGSLIPDDGSRYENGIYEILNDENFLWRMRVNGKTYISDNIITSKNYEKIYALFSNKINSGLPIYISENTYSKGNIDSNGNNIQMDTAYKFQTGLYNKWTGSNTFSGGTDGWDSFINYYDNLIYFPKTINTTIYVRYIDVTGVDNYTSDVINEKALTSKFKKVGWGRINADTNDQTTIWSYPDANFPEYQDKFIVTANELHDDSVITIYDKLYNETTRTTTDGNNEKDTNDYSGYSLVGTQYGIGDNMEEATQNRDEKYGYKPDADETIQVYGDNLGKTVVIDFLYEKSNPQVYIRHVDTTGIEDNFDSTTISNYAYTMAYSESGRYIKNVGFAESTNDPTNGRRIQDTSIDKKEYEYYKLNYTDLEKNGPVRLYNKLYSDTTKKSKYGLSKDETDYSKYSLGMYNNKNYVCIVAQGNTLSEAEAERDKKINNKDFQNVKYVDLDTNTKPYVFIDFYYRSNIQEEKVTLLVRHINVTGMSTGDYKAMNNLVSSGNLGTDVFDGYNKLDKVDESGKINVYKNGQVTYNNSYYNEVYESLKSNKEYKLYNEFYNPTTENDYEYIGYIMNGSNYSQGVAEAYRNIKINGINFSELDTLDEKDTDGYAKINTGNYKYIVVDMYYKEKDTMPVKEAPVTGRLTFDSVKDDFTKKTSNTYDVIPSGEDMYTSITNANKYMLGGIRIVDMSLTGTLEVTLNVNVKYSYSYSYLAGWDCKNNHRGYTEGKTCTVVVNSSGKKCGETYTTPIYTTAADFNKIETLKFNYELPYEYKYYKVSNMRVYTIDHMELYDTENDTDLPLFDGKKHTISVSDVYKESVKGEFKRSETSQTLIDDRDIARVWESEKLQISVNLPNVDFGLKTYTDKARVSGNEAEEEVKALRLNDEDNINGFITAVEKNITEENAPLITNVDKSGNVSEITKDEGARIKITVSNDQIKIGEEDILAKSSSAKSVTKSISLSDYEAYNEENPITVATTYPDNIYKQYGFDEKNGKISKTTQSDFMQDDTTKLSIPMSRLNGERISKAKIYYKLSEDPALSFDAEPSDINKKPHNWKLNSATVTGSFKDTEMNKDNYGEKVETRIVPGANLPEEKTYDFTSSKTSFGNGTGDVVNVFTPVKFRLSLSNGFTGTNQTIVDHTVGDDLITNATQIIQKDTRFTITLKPENSHQYYGKLSEGISKYIDSYYIKFNDLDVQEIEINGKEYNNGNAVAAGRWIGPIENIGNDTKISAIARDNPNYASSVLEQDTNSYVIRGVTKNATSKMHNDLKQDDYDEDLITTSKSMSEAQNSFSTSAKNNILRHGIYYIKKKLYNDNNYVAETKVITTKNLSRVYDFKVTDVKDLDWKDTFRKSTTTTTNVHSGIVYYSGVNKWNIYSTTFKDIQRRTTDEIGDTSQRILPVGPYKNTNSSYVYAPKLGYRFSFDFKTTGKIDAGKEANINVSFMFIDKTKGVADDKRIQAVDLYYKNSSNKYVKIDGNDTMNIYYVPNDGYRLTFTENTYNFNTSTLSSTTVKLGSLTKLKLTSKMRAVSDNEFSQIWYGEYKLPNSTIAVAKGESDLNKKKTNGYIAVKFEITVTDNYKNRESITISYSQNDKAATNSHNTSQWDYEGYLGFNSPGSNATNLKLRLDSGVIWNINDEIYNKLKGTVMLYDVDSRAASDYN